MWHAHSVILKLQQSGGAVGVLLEVHGRAQLRMLLQVLRDLSCMVCEGVGGGGGHVAAPRVFAVLPRWTRWTRWTQQ